MLALSLWQPWASLIALGAKRYETRSWNTAYRGPLLIHAAKRPIDQVGWDLLRRLADCGDGLRSVASAIRSEPVYGAIACRVRLADCAEAWPGRVSQIELQVGKWQSGRYAFELADVLRLDEPIACRGQQGLWMQDVPTWVHDAPPAAAAGEGSRRC